MFHDAAMWQKYSTEGCAGLGGVNDVRPDCFSSLEASAGVWPPGALGAGGNSGPCVGEAGSEWARVSSISAGTGYLSALKKKARLVGAKAARMCPAVQMRSVAGSTKGRSRRWCGPHHLGLAWAWAWRPQASGLEGPVRVRAKGRQARQTGQCPPGSR